MGWISSQSHSLHKVMMMHMRWLQGNKCNFSSQYSSENPKHLSQSDNCTMPAQLTYIRLLWNHVLPSTSTIEGYLFNLKTVHNINWPLTNSQFLKVHIEGVANRRQLFLWHDSKKKRGQDRRKLTRYEPKGHVSHPWWRCQSLPVSHSLLLLLCRSH